MVLIDYYRVLADYKINEVSPQEANSFTKVQPKCLTTEYCVNIFHSQTLHNMNR